MAVANNIDVKAYPLDLSGELLSNRVTERHTVTANNDDAFQVIIPRAAPFFFKLSDVNNTGQYQPNFTIRHVETNRELVYGRDYTVTYVLPQMSRYTKHNVSVYGGISIFAHHSVHPYNDPDGTRLSHLGGTYELTFQTLGGDYILSETDFLRALKNATNRPLIISFNELLNRPVAYPAKPHAHAVDEFTDNYHSLVTLLSTFSTEVKEGLQEQSKLPHSSLLNYHKSINVSFFETLKKLVETTNAQQTQINELISRMDEKDETIRSLVEHVRFLHQFTHSTFGGDLSPEIKWNMIYDKTDYEANNKPFEPFQLQFLPELTP